MSRPLVVDASVALRWVVNGPGSDEAVSVLEEHNRGALSLCAPALQRAEVANALWRYRQTGLMTQQQVESSYDRYLAETVRYHDGEWLNRTALVLASVHARSVYDCLYLALSIELGCELLTADRRFFNAVGTSFPLMRMLKTGDAKPGS